MCVCVYPLAKSASVPGRRKRAHEFKQHTVITRVWRLADWAAHRKRADEKKTQRARRARPAGENAHTTSKHIQCSLFLARGFTFKNKRPRRARPASETNCFHYFCFLNLLKKKNGRDRCARPAGEDAHTSLKHIQCSSCLASGRLGVSYLF